MNNISIEQYEQRLKEGTIATFKSRLPVEEINSFTATLMRIAEEFNNYQIPPEDIIELVKQQIIISRIKPIDICSLNISVLVQDLNKQYKAMKEYYIKTIIEKYKEEGMKAPPVNDTVSLYMLNRIYEDIMRACR